jgi:hypothetical protein
MKVEDLHLDLDLEMLLRIVVGALEVTLEVDDDQEDLTGVVEVFSHEEIIE